MLLVSNLILKPVRFVFEGVCLKDCLVAVLESLVQTSSLLIIPSLLISVLFFVPRLLVNQLLF